MCYVKRGKAPFKYLYFQCFSCQELRISDQGIITERAPQKYYALRVAPNMFETSGFFVCAFEKLRKATISFVMSFSPSVSWYVPMEQLASHWTDFNEIWY